MSRKSEREAAQRAQEILRAAHGRGEEVGGDYGAGPMTKAQKKSQATHIGWTPGPQTAGQKLKRAWLDKRATCMIYERDAANLAASLSRSRS